MADEGKPPVRPHQQAKPQPALELPTVRYPFLAGYTAKFSRRNVVPWVGCAGLIGLLVGLVLVWMPHNRSNIWLVLIGFPLLWTGSMAKWVWRQSELAALARKSNEEQIMARTQAFAKALAQKVTVDKGERLLPTPVLDRMERIVKLEASVAARSKSQSQIRPELATEAGDEGARMLSHALGVASGARNRFLALEIFPQPASPDQVAECLSYLDQVEILLDGLLTALEDFEPEPAKEAIRRCKELRQAQGHYVVNFLPPPE